MIARNAEKKLDCIVALITRPGTGFRPAAIIARRPARVMKQALTSPKLLSRSKVRGRATMSTATEKMRTRYIAQRPLFDRTDNACWPDNISDP